MVKQMANSEPIEQVEQTVPEKETDSKAQLQLQSPFAPWAPGRGGRTHARTQPVMDLVPRQTRSSSAVGSGTPRQRADSEI